MSFDCSQGDCCPPDNCGPALNNAGNAELVCANGLCATPNTARSLPQVDIDGIDLAAAPARTGIQQFFFGDSQPPVPRQDTVIGQDVVSPRPGLIDPAPRPDGAGGLTADQIRQVLADRDRAMALRRGEKPGPGGVVGPVRNDIMPPAPDGRIPPGDRTVNRPERIEFQAAEYEAAKEAARASNRPLLIEFNSSNCGWCTKMDQESWPAVKGKVDDNFIVVKADARGNLARRMGVSGAPATVIARPDGSRIDSLSGFVDSSRLSGFLDGGLQVFKNNQARPQNRPFDTWDEDDNGW